MALLVLDFGAFSDAEKTAMLAAAKAELLARMSGGTVRSGGSAAQQYSMDKMSDDLLVATINGLTASLGLSEVNDRVSPNFNPTGSRGPAYFGI